MWLKIDEWTWQYKNPLYPGLTVQVTHYLDGTWRCEALGTQGDLDSVKYHVENTWLNKQSEFHPHLKPVEWAREVWLQWGIDALDACYHRDRVR